MGQQSTGGTVVQQTAPWAANLAGYYGSQAAQYASDQATQQFNTAINNLNQQYLSTSLALQPTTQTGVQALDQLNQYLGLNAYTPSNAPVAPTAPTLDSISQGISQSAINNYIMMNSMPVNTGDPGTNLDYMGAGWTDNRSGFPGGALTDPNPQFGTFGAGEYGNLQTLTNNGGIQAAARNALAQQAMPQAQKAYDIAQQQYQMQQANYNQDKAWAQQYGTPLTAQQISDNISSQPGYQAQLGQGIDAINKSGAANGYLGSGRLLKELNQFGQNTLSQYYGQTLQRLAGLAGAGQQATDTGINAGIQTNNALDQLYSSLGENQANATLAGANSLANALTAANQQFNVIGQQQTSGLGGIGSALGGLGSLVSSFYNPSSAL